MQPTSFGRSFRTLFSATALGGLALLLAACSEEPVKVVEEIRPVKILTVEPSEQVTELVYSGSVKARTEMNMGFRLNGKINERLVDVGDRVHKGALLMRLDSVDLQLAVDRAKANLVAANQQFETANAAFKRADQLFNQKTIAMAVLEQRKLSLDQATSARASAISALNEYENQLSYADLKADRDGVVTAVNADAGQVIGAGNVAVVIAADAEKEVQIAVPETDVTAFSVGQPVRAEFWADNAINLEGRVREIAASADPLSRTYAIRISLESDPRVLLGMTATIKAERKNSTPGVTVPLSALSKQQGQTIVWLVDAASETVSARPVTTSAFVKDGVQIEKGLGKGDLVVAAGTQFMTDKRKVRLPDGLKETLAANATMKPAS